MESQRLAFIAFSVIYITVFVILILLGVEEKQLEQLHHILPIINENGSQYS
jgi:hypothetical protein